MGRSATTTTAMKLILGNSAGKAVLLLLVLSPNRMDVLARKQKRTHR